MNIPVAVDQLIRGRVVEQARIEYKEGWNPEVIVHTLCAFANDISNIGGGYLVIGVREENGMPVLPVTGVPVESLDSLQKKLVGLCHRIEPLYMPVVQPVKFEGKYLLLIWAPGGYERPYQAPISLAKKGSGRAHYVRRYSNTVRASQSEVDELMFIGGSVPFDDRINYQTPMSELRTGLMMDYLSSVNSNLLKQNSDPVSLAMDLRVASGPSENMHPLNVGLMFFTEDPTRYFRLAQIEIVDIPDPTGEGMTERIFRGPLNRQLADALRFIRNTVIAEKVFKLPNQAEAIRVFNYPYAAIEEALTNAIYHKSYQIPEPVTVRIERDRIIITSVPGPDRSISDDDIKRNRLVSKRYRNRRIGDFLKELHLSEGRNTGVPTMLRALKDNGSMPPIFETDEDRSYFSVTFIIHSAFMNDESEIGDVQSVRDSSRSVRDSSRSVRDTALPPMTAQMETILDLALRNQVITTKVVATQLGVGARRAQKILKFLTDEHLLERRGAARDTQYVPTVHTSEMILGTGNANED